MRQLSSWLVGPWNGPSDRSALRATVRQYGLRRTLALWLGTAVVVALARSCGWPEWIDQARDTHYDVMNT
jgi:hypothetical protein